MPRTKRAIAMRSSINEPIRLVGTPVTISVNGSTISGTLISSGNHGVVLEVDGVNRTFSGHVSVRPATELV